MRVLLVCCVLGMPKAFEVCCSGGTTEAPLAAPSAWTSIGDQGSLTNIMPQALAEGVLWGTNNPVSVTNVISMRKTNWLFDPALGLSGNREPLSPGVYKTEPYTMIVKVPEGHPDDKMIIGTRSLPKMPSRQPDLKFIPRTAPAGSAK